MWCKTKIVKFIQQNTLVFVGGVKGRGGGHSDHIDLKQRSVVIVHLS